MLNRVKALARKYLVSWIPAVVGRLPSEFDNDTLVGMTSIHEQEYYARCASEVAHLSGTIVDLGCWMGSTTIPLAKGASSERPQGGSPDRVFAFDRFIWESWMDIFSSSVNCDYLPGDSFLPEARRRIRDQQVSVELVQADLTTYEWSGESIKVLLVDAMKNVDLMKRINCQFFPCLLQGALLIHQDFKHWYTWWIHLLQFRLREYCEFSEDVKESGTLSFKIRRVISSEVAREASFIEGISDEEVAEAFNYSLSLVSSEMKSAVAAAHIKYFLDHSRFEKAKEILEAYLQRQFPSTVDFEQIRRRFPDYRINESH